LTFSYAFDTYINMSKTFNPSVRGDISTGAITKNCIKGAHSRLAHRWASACSSYATGAAHAAAQNPSKQSPSLGR